MGGPFGLLFPSMIDRLMRIDELLVFSHGIHDDPHRSQLTFTSAIALSYVSAERLFFIDYQRIKIARRRGALSGASPDRQFPRERGETSPVAPVPAREARQARYVRRTTSKEKNKALKLNLKATPVYLSSYRPIDLSWMAMSFGWIVYYTPIYPL